MVTGVFTGVVAGLWVDWIRERAAQDRQRFEDGRSLVSAGLTVLERLQTIDAACNEGDYRVADAEKWDLSSELNTYRDTINLVRGSLEAGGEARIERQLRFDILKTGKLLDASAADRQSFQRRLD
jgi:hypothetical protein